MHINFATITLLGALAVPIFAAKTWDVNWGNDGKPNPQELDIAPGDTVRWPNNNDNKDHAIVETIPGPRSCIPKPGGFNSGRKTPGQAYQRTFPNATTVNYKDGIGANCLNGAHGTIYVHTGERPKNGTNPTSTSTSMGATGTTSMGATGTTSMGATGTTMTMTPTTSPTGAAAIAASGNSAWIGLAAMIGVLVI